MKLIQVYEKLLTAYPKSYRNEYADEMSLTLIDMLAEEPRSSKRAAIWVRVFAELPAGLLMANLHLLEGAYGNNAPSYVTRNTQLSAVMVLPFVALVVFNELRPDRLPNTASAVDVLQFFTIGLPLVAFLLSVTTVVMWSNARHKAGKSSTLRNLTDIKRNWPLALVGGFALVIVLFMVGHDSAHCLSGNPLKEFRNVKATALCVRED